MQQVPRPAPGANEVLVKLHMTAICGTDLHIYKWDEWSQRTIKPGLVIGHEFIGTIAGIGPGVTGYQLGQRVSAEGHVVCGHCRNCRAGRPHLCPNTVGIGVNRNGAFAEYVVVPSSNLWPIPDEIPSELAAFFDPFGNAAHCALERSEEHTSELQSLMRISYAVFCLKKKHNKQIHTTNTKTSQQNTHTTKTNQ